MIILGTLNIGPDEDVYHELMGNRYLTQNEDLRSIKPDTFIDLQRSVDDDLETVTYKPNRKSPIKREEANYHAKNIVDYILAADNGAIAKKCWTIPKVDTVSNIFFRKGEKVKYSDHKLLVVKLEKAQ